MSLTNRPESAVIVGAGIGGLTLATALTSQGVPVDVVEQASKPGDVGAGIQLGPNAMQVLTALGIDTAIEEQAFAPNRAVLRNYVTGKPLLVTGLNPQHQRRYGQKYLHVHRADLHAALLDAALAQGARVHFDHKAVTVHREPECVRLECENAAFSGQLVVGADGVHSTVRDSILEQGSIGQDQPHSPFARFSGQAAWRGLVPADRVPKGLISPDANVWLGPGQHFVAYYVRGGSLINFVAVREQKSWVEESWHQPGDVNELRTTFAVWDDAVNQLLDACDTCFYWGLFDRVEFSDWYRDRVTLLGDACHPMLPFMAQGAAMAIEDAWVLASRLADPALSVDQSLHAYQSERWPRTAAMQDRSSDNARLYHLSNPVSVAIRNAGFAIASAAPFLAHPKLDPVFGLDVTRNDT